LLYIILDLQVVCISEREKREEDRKYERKRKRGKRQRNDGRKTEETTKDIKGNARRGIERNKQ
jgi:hypothetical protein